MESIYNSNGFGLRTYTFDGICTKIVQNGGEILDEDFRMIFCLYPDQIVHKAMALIDEERIELLSIPNTGRSYFSVEGPKMCYTLYPRINYCPCFSFKMSIMKKEEDVTCKHLLACHIALATGQYRKRKVNNFP